MNNFAYSDKYQSYVKKRENEFFTDKRFLYQEIKKLDEEYSLEIKTFSRRNLEDENHIYLTAQDITLINNRNEIIFSYRTIDNHLLNKIIRHSNGRKYLIFCKDLYGYSVLDLSSLEVFDFFPEESFEQESETFIWCDVFYNPENNIIAIDGCYWACPYSIVLMDFTNPMQTSVQVDLWEKIKNVNYNDILFECWENDLLVVKVEKIIEFLPNEYMSWLSECKG